MGMDQSQRHSVIQSAERLVRSTLKGDSSGHDWWHIHRVRKLAVDIGEKENCGLFVCELAALLHDLIDEKLVSNVSEAIADVKSWLAEQKVSKVEKEHIISIITNLSFKGGKQKPLETIEGKVVQDADRLDALGAIGIGRTFSYSGATGQLMFDPEIKVRNELTNEEYRTGKTTAINHFYEKLFKLSDLMNTETGKKVAEQRHLFMEQFIEQFYKEWDGEQ